MPWTARRARAALDRSWRISRAETEGYPTDFFAMEDHWIAPATHLAARDSWNLCTHDP